MAVAAAAAVAGTSAPSSAALQLMAADVAVSDSGSGSGTAPAPTVTAACSIDAAVLQGGGIQFVVSGSANASGGVGLATHVHCVIRTTSGSYGGPSGDLVGPTAVAAGPSNTVPFDKLGGLRVCAYGSAFFQGGITKNTIPSTGC